MQKVTKNVDALGFDKWQIADVRRAYQSNKSTYTKMARVEDKIKKLADEYNGLKAELEAWEGPVKVISNKVLGMELTSQEVLAYHVNPQEFYNRYPEHPLSVEAAQQAPEIPQEEETQPAETPVEEATPVVEDMPEAPAEF